MEWLPIETAPKDGTEILVWRDGEVSVALWRNPFLNTCEEAEWLGITASDPNGRRSCTRMEARFPRDNVLSGTPTHWMPLPDNPSNPV